MFTTVGAPDSAASRTGGPAPRHGSVTSGSPPDVVDDPDVGHGSRSARRTNWPWCGLGDRETGGRGGGGPPDPRQPTAMTAAQTTTGHDRLTACPRSGSAT